MPYRDDFDMIGSAGSEKPHYYRECCKCNYHLSYDDNKCPSCGDDVSLPEDYEERMAQEMEWEMKMLCKDNGVVK